MTPVGMKILLYFMVVIMNAPLPTPRKTTASGKTQQREATNAEVRLTIPDFMLGIHILIILQNSYSLLKYHILRNTHTIWKPRNVVLEKRSKLMFRSILPLLNRQAVL